MSKTHQIKLEQQEQAPEGGDLPAQDEVHSTDSIVENAPSDAGADTQEEQLAEIKPVALGIGAFVRHLLKNSKKSNAEILALVLATFEGSKTTPACIAWYKTDMRKKGLLEGTAQRGKNVVVEFTAEQLKQMAE